MSAVSVDEKVEVKTTRRCTLKLGRAALLDLLRRDGFDVPPSAAIYVNVPGGGDWSNMQLDLSRDNPVTVTWSTEETS